MAFLSYGCSKEEKPKNLVARVEKSNFTSDDFRKLADTLRLSYIDKKLIIENWIENELLALEGINEKFDKDDVFLFKAEYNKKKILAAFFLERYFEENKIEISDKEISEYFKNKKDDLNFNYDIYKVNQIIVTNLTKANELRNSIAIKLNFKNVINQVLSKDDIYEVVYDTYLKDFQVEPAELNNVMTTMLPGEITYPISIDKNKFLLTQLVEKYSRGNTPTLDFVKELITDRIRINKQKQLYRDLIKNLINKYEIEIKEYE